MNAEAQIACAISFQCPKIWDQSECTADPIVFNFYPCERNVHLALTEEDFHRYSEVGICVAIPIIPTPGESQTLKMFIIGDFERDG